MSSFILSKNTSSFEENNNKYLEDNGINKKLIIDIKIHIFIESMNFEYFTIKDKEYNLYDSTTELYTIAKNLKLYINENRNFLIFNIFNYAGYFFYVDEKIIARHESLLKLSEYIFLERLFYFKQYDEIIRLVKLGISLQNITDFIIHIIESQKTVSVKHHFMIKGNVYKVVECILIKNHNIITHKSYSHMIGVYCSNFHVIQSIAFFKLLYNYRPSKQILFKGKPILHVMILKMRGHFPFNLEIQNKSLFQKYKHIISFLFFYSEIDKKENGGKTLDLLLGY